MRLNGPAAGGRHLVFNLHFREPGDRFVLNLENGALTYSQGAHDYKADATLTLDRSVLEALVLQTTTIEKAIAAGQAQSSGNAGTFSELMSLMDTYDKVFAIIEP